MKLNPAGGGTRTPARLDAAVWRGHPCAPQGPGRLPAAAVARVAFLVSREMLIIHHRWRKPQEH